MSETHYFATTCLAWAVADTLAQALEKVAKYSHIQRGRKMYCCTYKVEGPKNASYPVENYMPKGVKLLERREFDIVNNKGHVVPLEPKLSPDDKKEG